MEKAEEKVELVLFPVPGIGHLISAVELAKSLFKHHPFFSITVLLMPLSSPVIDAYVQSVAALDLRFLTLPPLPRPEDTQGPESFISSFVDSYKPLVKDAIQEIKATHRHRRLGGLIIDFFSTSLIDVGAELGIPTYVYFTSGVALLGLMLRLPALHHEIPCEFADFQGEVGVAGFLPLPPSAMPAPIQNKKGEGYRWFVHHGRRFREAQGIIVNTFAELEPRGCDAIASGRCLPPDHPTPSIFPVGPVLALEQPRQSKSSGLFEWLDAQPHASVVFLCFGSAGAFSAPQIAEIAAGLEQSGHRFLWSVRSRPKERYVGLVDGDLDQVLPDGFLERTKGWGLVWPSWLPQVAVLAHPAVGGFVSHCGWNSTQESLWFGVPILAWPLYAEQRLNAFVLVKDYGVAVELRLGLGAEEVVSAAEVERGVRCLMGESEEGVNVRRKVKEMGEAGRKAVEEGGSSFASLARLADVLVSNAKA
ncbi:hypothetical protein ACLOJK_029700 [Asimina triloba]